jgi:hypothetical protein
MRSAHQLRIANDGGAQSARRTRGDVDGTQARLTRVVASRFVFDECDRTIRRIARNVERWRGGQMAERWSAAGLHEAQAGFRRINGYRQIDALRRALAELRLDEVTEVP